MSTTESTSPPVTAGVDPLTIEQHAPADLLDQATAYVAEIDAETPPEMAAAVINQRLVDALRAELYDARAALDLVTQALDRERPAPHPRALGRVLKGAFFRNTAQAYDRTPDERWTAAADAAIDMLRGLTPATIVAGGGEVSAAGPPPTAAATGAPAPGDPTTHVPTPRRVSSVDGHVQALAEAMWSKDNLIGHTDWNVLRASIRSFYLARAEAAIAHLAEHGWRPAAAPVVVTDLHRDHLAAALLDVDHRGAGPDWDDEHSAAIKHTYRRLADTAITAGWHPGPVAATAVAG